MNRQYQRGRTPWRTRLLNPAWWLLICAILLLLVFVVTGIVSLLGWLPGQIPVVALLGFFIVGGVFVLADSQFG